MARRTAAAGGVRRAGSCVTLIRARLQPVQERSSYVGMVEQVEVIGAGHVQEIGIREQPPASGGGDLVDQ